MEKIVKDILKIFFGLLIIVSSFYYGYNYLNSVFKTEGIEDDGSSFHSMPEDSIDVLVIGSSHAQYSFVPSFFYQDTGLYSYMLGSALQPIEVSYEMLREALKTQSPKLVVLEIYTLTKPLDNTNGDYDYRYTMAYEQLTGKERQETIDFISDEEKALSYKNEFINNHNNWRTIEDVSSLFEKNESINTLFGYVANWDVEFPVDNYWYSSKYDSDTDIEISDHDLDYLNKIYDLCVENNIELLLYKTPMDNVSEDMQTLRHKVWDWANERNIKYLDLLENDETLDIRSNIHHDGYHMYINGASIVTDLLATYISENYTFDHIDNETLNEYYKENIPSLSVGILEREFNPRKYLSRLKDYPSTLLVSYRDLEIDETLRAYLDNIGLYDLTEGQTFYGVINNGKLIASSNEQVECEVNGHSITVDGSGIYFDGEYLTNDDTLTFVAYNYKYDSHSIKKISYRNGVLWDKDYNFNYNYQGN